MRIERTGPVEPLTPRLVRFLEDGLGATALDDLQRPEDRRADYACLNGLLAIELKTLEEDAAERMDNLTEELRQRDDWPIFLGSAPMQAFIENTSDPEGVRLKVLNRVGRAIINHLKKANKQLAAHAEAFPRKNLVRVMLLVNEDHEIYDPEMVAYILHHALRRTEKGAPLYPKVDAVIFMSERHATTIERRIAFPIVYVQGAPMAEASWKDAVVERFMRGWADWNQNPLHTVDGLATKFTTIDHIPESAPRHERWRTDYRRNPYMRHLTNDQLRDRFDESIFISTLAFIKGSPAKPSQQTMMANMALFTHLMLEMGDRAIPITQFQHSAERLIAAGGRLHMPDSIIHWVEQFERDRTSAA